MYDRGDTAYLYKGMHRDYERSHSKDCEDKYIELISKIVNEKYVPDEIMPKWLNQYRVDFNLKYRDLYIDSVGYVVVTKAWVEPLANWMKINTNSRDVNCLELFAGTGYLSYVLSLYDINCIAVDNLSLQNAIKPNWRNSYYTIEAIENEEAIAKYIKDMNFCIMGWPTYATSEAADDLKLIRKHNPNCWIIYIGEGYGGCTADDEFHDILEDHSDELPKEINDNYHTWYSLHDKIYLIK